MYIFALGAVGHTAPLVLFRMAGLSGVIPPHTQEPLGRGLGGVWGQQISPTLQEFADHSVQCHFLLIRPRLRRVLLAYTLPHSLRASLPKC